MPRTNAPLFAGLAVAGGVGYYLYSAGGSARGAEKQFEHDLKSARDRATGASSKFQTDAEKYGARAGAVVDDAVSKAQSEYNKAAVQARDAAGQARDAAAGAVDKAENYGKDIRSQVNKSIDDFDRKVEDAASKTKTGVSSWFGGK